MAACLVATAWTIPTPLPAAGHDLTVQLDWTYGAQFAGLLVAEARGYFQDAGLNVRILPVDTGMATAHQVTTHEDWIGISEADVVVVDRSQGEPIKAFATMLQTTPFALITLKSSGITSVAQLKGRRVGLHADGQKAIDVILGFNHMTRSDITIVQIPYSLDALLQGKVDAVQGYLTDEAVALERSGHPVNLLPFGENGYVSYAEVLFTSEATLARRAGDLPAFTAAVRRGWQYALSHPDDTARLLADRYHADGGAGEQRAELEKLRPLVTYESPNPGDILTMRRATWEDTLKMFARYQLVSHPVSYDQLVYELPAARPSGPP
jgi:ABC-type nitrate/sulfonate/bicarbonate transport system substrate-binding protein